jgi:hypothetical protein
MSDAAVLDDVVDVAAQEVVEKRSSSPCMAKLDRLTWATCDWFDVEGYRFGVRSTSHAFGEWVRYALGAYRADGPLDPDADSLYALIVEDGLDSDDRAPRRLHIFYYGTWGIVRTTDVRAIARSLIGEIESLTFPIRDDAVYVEASVVRGGGKTILISSLMINDISAAGRRIRNSVDLMLPGQMSVALDPASGHLIPPSRYLAIPDDALDAVGRFVPVSGPEDIRAIVDRELEIDRIILMAMRPVPGLDRTPKGPVLFNLARSIRNLGMVGSQGLRTLGRLVDQAETLEARWDTTAQLVEVLAAAVDGGRYVPDRTEGTPEAP